VTIWAIIAQLADWVGFTWLMAAVPVYLVQVGLVDFPSTRMSQFFRFVYFELRPFYIPCCTVYWTYQLATHMAWYSYILLAMQVWNWFMLRDVGGDDDRWKRRAKKLASKVAVQAGKLVVVPARAGT